MSDNQAFKLIAIYLKISDLYVSHLKNHCMRFTNNNEPEFTDTELITIYIFCIIHEQRSNNTQIYKFADNYLRSWFPKLPSYTAFNTRLNNLAAVFEVLAEILMSELQPETSQNYIKVLDSMPVITCSGKRKAKVAPEITDKGFNSTKNMYFYGLKLHFLNSSRKGKLPVPLSFVVTPASENDLNVFKQFWSDIPDTVFFGDKIYQDKPFFQDVFQKYNSLMYTPIKAVKGEAECLKLRDKAYNDLFSKAVSTIREPIESFFNWLIQKTDIQRASKVRSAKGLLVHIFGRIAAALLVFNS